MEKAKLFHSRIVASNNLFQITLSDLLKNLSLKHCKIANVNDPGSALSNILNAQYQTDKLKKKFKITYWEKEKIYQTNPNVNNLQFQQKLQIDSMDVPLLYKLLTKIKTFPTYKKKQQNFCRRPATNNSCCGQCSHLCIVCNKEECPPNCQNKINNVWDHPCRNCGKTKNECIEANCLNCINKITDLQCGVHNLSEGVDTSKKSRDVSFHLTLVECIEFVQQRTTLNGLHHCRTEKQLFQLISASFCSIVNFIANGGYFEENAITFDERRANINSMNLILFGKEGDISRDLVKNLSSQSIFLTEHIRRLQSEVTALQEEEEYNEVQLLLQRYSQEECQLILKGIKVTGISKVKIRQHSHGKIQSVDLKDYNYKHDDVEKVSVINIFHQIEEGSKYDYEVIIEDEQTIKWKASVYQLDPCDENLLKIEMLNGSKFYIPPHASIISKYPMRLEEKKACAITASFTSVGVKQIQIAECKEQKTKEWHRSPNLKVCHLKDDVYQLHGTMLPRGIFDFRVLVETTAGKYRLYELENITVLEQKGFQHASSCQKTLLISHPVGDKKDASETLKILSTHGEVGQNGIRVSIHLPGGGEATNDIDAIDYIEQNFLNRQKICFPPFYMMSANSPHVRISKLLEEHLQALERKRFIILPKVDITENLKTLGFTDDQITHLYTSEFEEKLQSPLVSIVFDIDSRTVLLITLSHISESLQETHIRSNRIVKAFLAISENLIGQAPIAVVGVVACSNSSREMAKGFCKECSRHILTGEEMETPDLFKKWFDNLSNNVGMKLRSHLGQPLEESSLESPLLRIANRFMILTSISDCSLPMGTVGSDEEKINKLLLTPEQIGAVYDDQYKKKVIKGNYGSGKSIVIKKKLEMLNSVEPKDDVIYYINWDPYSLINVEIWKSTMEVVKGNEQSTKSLKQDRVVCKNICQLSEEAGSHTVFSLSQCLKNISDAHPNQTAHVLIDEFDEEELTKEEETSISGILQASATFKDGHILVSVQSVEKERKSYLSKSNEPSVYKKGCWESCAFNIYMLPNTMRFTNNINDVVDNIQNAVAKQPNIYFATASQKSDSEKENKTVLFDQNTEMGLASGSSENLPSTRSYNNSSTETLTTQEQTDLKLRPEQNIDTLAKQSGIKQGDTGDNSRLETTFKFMSCVSGHKIKGSVPMLIRVDISHGINVDLINYFITTCFSEHKKALLICNDLALMRALVEVFQTIANICIIEYFHNLMEDLPPSFKTQKSVYEELISEEERNLLLLTDSRGCRGLEYKNVICIIDEREDFERHLVIENLCRATSKLHLISFQGVSQETDTHQIVDDLTTNNFVKDVTVNCMKQCSQKINYIKIDDTSYQHKQHQLVQRVQKLVFSELTEEDKQKNWTFEDLNALVRNKNYEKFRQMISIKPSLLHLRGRIDVYYFGSRNSLLHSASVHGSDVGFVQHLINAGCGLKEKTSFDEIPIHVAATNNHPDIVKLMLEKDPSLINEKNVRDSTSLHFAAGRNHKDVVELLLSFPNIDVNTKDYRGKMADDRSTNDEIKQMIRKHRKNNSL